MICSSLPHCIGHVLLRDKSLPTCSRETPSDPCIPALESPDPLWKMSRLQSSVYTFFLKKDWKLARSGTLLFLAILILLPSLSMQLHLLTFHLHY